MKSFVRIKKFVLPFECGAMKSMPLKGEDQRNLFVSPQEIVRAHFQPGSALGWFRAGLGAFPSFASRQRHHVVVLMSADSAQEKAKRFPGPAPFVWGQFLPELRCGAWLLETDTRLSCIQRQGKMNRFIVGFAVYRLQKKRQFWHSLFLKKLFCAISVSAWCFPSPGGESSSSSCTEQTLCWQ